MTLKTLAADQTVEKPRYYVEATGVSFRVTDRTTDSRVATCWEPENGEIVARALNAADRIEQLERAEKALQRLIQICSQPMRGGVPRHPSWDDLEAAREALK